MSDNPLTETSGSQVSVGNSDSPSIQTYVVHFSEVALKGKNRPEFVRTLRRNILKNFSEEAQADIRQEEGRIVLESRLSPDEIEERLSLVFGIAWFARAELVPATYEGIRDKVLESSRTDADLTFRISVRRNDKSFPMNSMELEARLGTEVIRETGSQVDLSSPARTLHVDILHGRAVVYSNRRKGLGGLPVGTAGRVMHLFSGGIDSPVAAWLLMKRGCTPVYLHFYLAPSPTYPLQSKILKIVKKLSTHSGKSTLILIPFANYQLATAGSPSDIEPSMFRLFMRLTAERLASRFGVSGISTGDSLSQAASQTIWNLGVFDHGSSLPLLRPLLTFDKEEVISMAKKIGTFESSIEDYRDCCAIVTKHPRTRARADIISRFAERLDLTRVAEESIRGGTLVTYEPSMDLVRTSGLNEVMNQTSTSSRLLRQNYKQGTSPEITGETT